MMVRVVPPVLVRVVCWDGLVPFTTAENFMLAGTSFTWPAVIVMVAPIDFVVSSTETAVSATVGFVGTLAGAV